MSVLVNNECDCENCGKRDCNNRKDFLADIERTLNEGWMEPTDVPDVLDRLVVLGDLSPHDLPGLIENLRNSIPALQFILPQPLFSTQRNFAMSRTPSPLGMPSIDDVENASPEEEYRKASDGKSAHDKLLDRLLKAGIVDRMDLLLEDADLLRVIRRRLDDLSPLKAVGNRKPRPQPLGIPSID